MKSTGIALGVLAAAATAASLSPSAAKGPDRPIFERFPAPRSAHLATAVSVPTWTYNWTYSGSSYNAAIVGTNPSAGSASTTVPVYVIPVQLTYGTTTESPLTKLAGSSQTVISNTLASPMFSSAVDFSEAGKDLGSTQYIDAYARGDIYGLLSNPSGYHVLLGTPKIEKLVKIKVPTGSGSVATDFGVKVINADINWFDTNVVQKNLTRLKIPSNAFAIFVTTQTYLTESGGQCCIGGYHSQAPSGTTYSHFTYIQKAGVFSQDVSALSHEVGEWQLDPFTTNSSSPCGGLLENGDPLEGTANYGDYPYTSNGFTYHLQDLVNLPYFGAPKTVSAGGNVTFQGTKLSVCQNGQ